MNTGALAGFCSGTNGFVKTWYDQSGNGNDATQTTAANQPKIYDSSTGVVTENGKPAVQFNGSNNLLSVSVTSSDIITTNAENTLLAVINQDAASDTNALVSMASPRFVAYTDFLGTLYYDAGNNTTNRLGVAIPIGWDDSQHLLFFSSSLALQQICVDGTQLASDSSQSTIASGSANLDIGQYNTQFIGGMVQELVLYNSDQSANRSGIETNLNDYYSIY